MEATACAASVSFALVAVAYDFVSKLRATCTIERRGVSGGAYEPTDLGVFARDVSDPSMRRRFARLVERYLHSMPECAERCGDDTLRLGPVAIRDHIGEGAWGEVFDAAGSGWGAVFRMSAKRMRATAAHRRECAILRAVSRLVLNGWVPNFPVVYKTAVCVSDDTITILSELANGSLAAWARADPRPSEERCLSALQQTVLSVLALHSLGYVHDDVGFENVLYHDVPPGGCWHYRAFGRDAYVRNAGHMCVLWDFGLSYDMRDMRDMRGSDDLRTAIARDIEGVVRPFAYRVACTAARALAKDLLALTSTLTRRDRRPVDTMDFYDEVARTVADSAPRPISGPNVTVINSDRSFDISVPAAWTAHLPRGEK